MISRRALVYVVAAACAALGVRWALESRKERAETDPGGTQLVTAPRPSRRPGALGGYNGSGESQVRLEGEANTVARPARPKGAGEIRSPLEAAGQRRAEELRRVLSNIDNEPVYVEGVDGPAPDKKPKAKQ